MKMYVRKKLISYKICWKFDDKQQYKAIIEADIVSTHELFTDNSPI